jgi:hypothetical protein
MSAVVVTREQAVSEVLELQLREGGDGLLTPKRVLDYARDPACKIHHLFTWSDSEAGEKWRLEEARRLIVSVRVLVADQPVTEQSTRRFVSLSTDRVSGNGYRTIEAVLANPTHRKTYIDDAMNELDAVRKRYGHVLELVELWKTLDAVKRTSELTGG